MKNIFNVTSVLVIAIATLSSVALGQDLYQSGFMTDYTQLEKITNGTSDYRWIAPGARERLAQYDAIMIDQPEVFIASDSEYHGVKPKQISAFADSLRGATAAAMSEHLYIVDQPGENVLYLTLAASNVKLTKRKKTILNYTPAGLVTGAVRGAVTSDIAKKADLQGLVMEGELFDSMTGERLVAIIDSRGINEEEAATWQEIDELTALYAARFICFFRNSRLPTDERVDCLAE